MKILKFGGSSVASAESIQCVTDIVKKQYALSAKLVVIVSALGGVTDLLIKAGHEAVRGDIEYKQTIDLIKDRHICVIETLLAEEALDNGKIHLEEQIHAMSDLVHGIYLIHELSKRTQDELMSFGERLSAYIVNAALQMVIPQSRFFDARKFIKTDKNFGNAKINEEHTYALIREHLSDPTVLPVVTGFIGSTEQQETTTLGRGGSDFTASIIGAALSADEIQIWTDVDGVMTADPKKVQNAFALKEMTYKEAMEISHFGAKVIYPPTISPACHANIPIWIKNTFNPLAPGTLIRAQTQNNVKSLIRGITSISGIALLRIEGSGIVGVCGMSKRLFTALAERGINVMIITQGSSEHSICLAVTIDCAHSAQEGIEHEFAFDMIAGLIEPVKIETGVTIVAVVGEQMRDAPGVSGTLFGALAKNGINIDLIAQGSSQYNITFVIKKVDEIKALNVIHEEFFLSPTKKLHVFLSGVGLIGRTLLSLIKTHQTMLQKEYGLEIKMVGVMNSKVMQIHDPHLTVDNWEQALDHAREPSSMTAFINEMKRLNLSNSVFVDCTASDSVPTFYPGILSSNISIVTPNKRANSGRYQEYKTLKELAKRKKITYSYEANVGGGLPIISTINNLLSSGDRIIKIEAVLSGTLSYIFSAFMQGARFSDVVKEAQDKGYTEPDPRDDLNGMDVMRKLLILARECNHILEMDDLSITPFLPEECFLADGVAAFYQALKNNDDALSQLRRQAQNEGKALRYVALFEKGKGSIALQSVNADHPFYGLAGGDNIIALTTERYCDFPLVIQGKGAGALVTAGKVLAGIIDSGRD